MRIHPPASQKTDICPLNTADEKPAPWAAALNRTDLSHRETDHLVYRLSAVPQEGSVVKNSASVDYNPAGPTNVGVTGHQSQEL